jgi:hypothetical protein
MAKIIDFQTKKRWRGPKPRQVAAQETTAKARAGGGNGFEQVGSIADRIVRRLEAR